MIMPKGLCKPADQPAGIGSNDISQMQKNIEETRYR